MRHHSVPHFLFILFADIFKVKILDNGQHSNDQNYERIKACHNDNCDDNGNYLREKNLHKGHHSLNAHPVAVSRTLGFLKPVEHIGRFK